MNTLDFTILAANFGQSGKLFSDGDFTGERDVDSVDLNVLLAEYGRVH